MQEPFFKENVAISSFRLVMYNNCTIKNYIWSRYVSVARNLTKVVLCEVYLSSSIFLLSKINYSNFSKVEVIKFAIFFVTFTKWITSYKKLSNAKSKNFPYRKLIVWRFFIYFFSKLVLYKHLLVGRIIFVLFIFYQ